ncbi:MAG: extracellular solute-binding protein [Spirochaetaceae bacterium]|jgi:ABC-type glycerol-3-phosphate transport system substrate-binding protein|nr:extracellular solute-binding protein [Spirochaetaceae bacterium]
MRFSYIQKLSGDKMLVVAALAALVIAVLLAPQSEIKFGRTDIVIAIPPEGIIREADFGTLIREFEAENKGIRVSIMENADDSSKKGADVIIFDPLSPDGVDMFEDERLLVGGINPLFYNISILQELGFDRPPKTRDDFLAVCRKIKGEGGAGSPVPFSFSRNVFHSVLPWFYQAGIDGLGLDEPLRIDWDSRAAKDAFAFLRVLIDEKLVADGSLDRSEDALVDDFIVGRCAMMICPVSKIKKIDEANPSLRYGITTIPAPAGYKGRAVFNMSVLDVAMAKGSEHREEAVLFLEFIEGKRGDIAAATGMFSGNVGEMRNRAPIFEKAADLYEASSLIDESKGLEAPLEQAERMRDALMMGSGGGEAPAALSEREG